MTISGRAWSGAVTYDEGVGLEAQHPVRAEVTPDSGKT